MAIGGRRDEKAVVSFEALSLQKENSLAWRFAQRGLAQRGFHFGWHQFRVSYPNNSSLLTV